jgi:hypothetical protein
MSGNMIKTGSGELVPAGSVGAYPTPMAGGRRGLKAKTLKRMLKKAGLKTSGKKSTLRARVKKAHLVRGGAVGLRLPRLSVDAVVTSTKSLTT